MKIFNCVVLSILTLLVSCTKQDSNKVVITNNDLKNEVRKYAKYIASRHFWELKYRTILILLTIQFLA